MSDIIELPMNYDRYLVLGQEAFEQESYLIACENFEAAYNLEETIEANVGLVNSLVASGQPAEALVVADELKASYFEKESLFHIYIHLLLANDYFIKAEMYLADASYQDWSLVDLRKKCELASNYFGTMSPEKEQVRLKHVADIENKGIAAQLASLKEIERLPKDTYIETVRPLLLKPRVALVARQGILMNLIGLQETSELSLLDIKGQVRLLSADITSAVANDEQLKEQVLGRLGEVLGVDSGLQLQQIQQEVIFQFNLLCPFATDYIKSPANWIDQILARYLNREEPFHGDKNVLEAQREILDLIQEELFKLTMG